MDLLSSGKTQSWLSWFLRGVLILVFLVLFSKLFEIQIIKGSYYRGLSTENRIRHIPIPAPRGKIYARGGETLVDNKEVKKRIKFEKNSNYELNEDVKGALPEEIVNDYQRFYVLGAEFAHVSGYLGEVSAVEVGKINPDCPRKGPYKSGSLVGKSGLELAYECLLSGTPGEELIEVNTLGVKIRSLGRREPIPGHDLTTTVDYNLQVETSRDMEGKKGAAIVTDVRGQVLAFYSGPSFDPNLLVQRTDNQKISELFSDPDLPFFDRVISGTFHPGSVFKPLVAVAALQEGVIDKNYVFDDPGVITINAGSPDNSYSYSNWYFSEFGRKEGLIGLTRAIARSTDTFFYKIGEKMGPEAIARWAQKFSLDKVTGIDLPGEVAGLIPTPEWKKRVKRENWFLGNTYHMSIGQGDVSLTPIQVNRYISAIANNSILCTPHLIEGSGNDKQRASLRGQMPNFKCEEIGVKKQNLDLVKEGMRQACQAGGTAFTFFDFAATHGGTQVGCKTGTAEVGVIGEPHAWFTVFGPFDNPQVVATVLIERGGQGSVIAGPVARKIMDYYFQALNAK